MCNIEDFIPFGKENAVINEQLQVVTGLDERTVRRAISDARKRGVVILNMQDGRGYYQPTDNERTEVEMYYYQERSRAMNNLATLKATKRWLDMIDGQLHIEDIKVGD